MRTTMRMFPRLRAVCTAIGSFAAILTAVPAMAQPAPEAPAATDDKAPADKAAGDKAAPAPEEKPKAEAPKADKAAEKMPDMGGTGSGGDDPYGIADEAVPAGGRLEWARRREIRVVQKRDVLKEGRHAFTLQSGVVPNDDFFVYPLLGLGYQYFFSEDLALDVHADYAFENQTSLQSSLTASNPVGPGLNVRLPQVLQGYATAGVDWYLLHGKFGFFSTHLTEFDLSLNFGVGAVGTKLTPIAGPSTRTVTPGGEIGADLLFYLAQNWALRLGYRQNFYKAEGGGVSYPISTTLAVTYFTSAPK
jgi:outer membrane beta-barrel protein